MSIHDTIQTVLTSGQRENSISIMSFFNFVSISCVQACFSWLESFMLHLHHIIPIITNLLSKVTYYTFFGVFTLTFLVSKT